jgi:FkbM family methyltransferase
MKADWPKDYGLPEDYCGDVLRGTYDVPFNPQKPPVILDIGANVGAFARWATTRWPGCRIHCYEPNPKAYPLLLRTVGPMSNVATYQYGIDDDENHGVVKLYQGPHNLGEASVVNDYLGQTESVDVVVNNTTILPPADILKIDAEGVERRILFELKTWGRLKPFSAVMLETHSELDKIAILALMKDQGFTLTNRHGFSKSRSELCYVRSDLIVPEEKPAKPVVWIVTPKKDLRQAGPIDKEMFDSLPEHYREPIRCLGEAATLPWAFNVYLIGGGNVCEARNASVKWFMESQAEYLFFVDEDLMPQPIDYVKVLRYMEVNRLLVCGGLYTTRETDGHWVMNYPDGRGPRPDGGMQVAELGTGFKCYHRKAFELVARKNPWLAYEDDDTQDDRMAFFSIALAKDEKVWPGKQRHLTEDYWMDWLCRDAGIPIVVQTTIQLKHRDFDGRIYPDYFPPVPGYVPIDVDGAQVEPHPST